MLDAAKIRTAKHMLRHVGLPALALGASMLAGAGINYLASSTINQWSQQSNAGSSASSQNNQELAGRLMAAELMAVEPVSNSQRQRSSRQRGSFAIAGQTTASNPNATPNTTSVPSQAPVANQKLVDQPATPASSPTVSTSLEAAVTKAVMSHDEHIAPEVADQSETKAVELAPPVVTARQSLPLGYRMFNGRVIRPARTITMVTTAYSPDERSCGPNADGTTASGKSVWTNGMKMVAADTRLLPFGTLVSVPGYYNSQPVPVLDRGGAIKGHRLDMLYPTHEIAVTWGRKTQKVTIWEYVD